ncbi:MAG: DUF1285 domain-containing protein [Gammaproteobacteria bacterium]|nr:DUF1285 domain-containing protein [Gammaproteobacteria bacterium]MDP2139192.1 DUF1285 domain-containing protein [Gammaproteobacteria bacterium]MDP2349039.1 DUF1285 domain-containing protein [Gammaproteobacteria bacterium]
MVDSSSDPENNSEPVRLLRTLDSVPGPAPIHLWNPPYCGEIDIRIARDGTWFHDGNPIRRIELVRLFSSVLRLEDDGRHYLVTPVEKLGIQVEDCPFVAQLVERSGRDKEQSLDFVLNTGERVAAGPEHKIQVSHGTAGAEPHPVVHVRNGLQALLSRNVFYELVDMAVEEKAAASGSELVVWSHGARFVLGSLNN